MSNTTALLIMAMTPNPTEKETFGRYLKASGEMSAQYGANVIARMGVAEHLHGDTPATLIGIAEFPSAQAIKEMFGSAEYKALIPDRDKAISNLNLYISAPGQTIGNQNDDDQKSILVTLAAPNPAEKEALAAYGKAVGPLTAQYGGQGLARIGIVDQITGETPAAFLALAQFPNSEAVKGFFADDAYQKLIPLREKALSSLNLYLAG